MSNFRTDLTQEDLKKVLRYSRKICPECESIETAYHLNSNKSVAVADDYYWNEDMRTCPRGAKVLLLGEGGVASIGLYFGDRFWLSWAPLPKRRGKT